MGSRGDLSLRDDLGSRGALGLRSELSYGAGLGFGNLLARLGRGAGLWTGAALSPRAD